MTRSTLLHSTSVAVLLAAAVAQSAHAGTDVSISGATLFESFFAAPASTNDFVNVNGNAYAGYNDAGNLGSLPPYVESFAPVASAANLDGSGNFQNMNFGTVQNGTLRSDSLTIKYRGTGSVEGIAELLSYQGTGTVAFQTLSTGRVNGAQVVANGVPVTGWTTDAASKFPTAMAVTKVDIAVSDVTTQWAAQGTAGMPTWSARPTSAGYGQNSVTSSTGYSNKLITLTSNPIAGTGTAFNTDTAAPGANTLYNTSIATVPINIIANPGVGTAQITGTDVQHLYVTGRTSSGENLAAVTRSVGSGTRNAAMNSFGIDPSFGLGDNLGTDSAQNANKQLGAGYQSSNMNGSGDMATNVRNNRLAIGYQGSDRAKTDGDGALYGSLAVMFDNLGGTAYVVPSASTMVHNADPSTGWRVFGNETFITRGDPNATAVGSYAGNGNPAMANADAAKYIRNITESIAAYTGDPTGSASFFMPVSQLASNFLLRSATDYIQNSTDGTFYSVNTGQVASVRDAALGATKFNAKLVSDATITNGFVPQRVSFAGGYSDGSTTGGYLAPASATGGTFTVLSSARLNDRNKVSGDFNGDGARNLSDVPKLIEAFNNPRAFSFNNAGSGSVGTTGMAADYAIPEILGDFNGDGNFDRKDVRYFADGLAMTTGASRKLDRKAGFTAVDANFAGNFFGTTLATGKAYAIGDARGDVAGAAALTAGAGPTGFDGTVNGKDIDYVWKQARGAMGNGTDGSFATLLTRASADSTIDVRADLSADMNGDLKIDRADVDELVHTILGTEYGDADLSRVVDLGDFNIWFTNVGSAAGTWSTADFDGSGIVDLADFNTWFSHVGFSGAPLAAAGAAVPEPASLALLGMGAAMLLGRRRKA